LKLASVIETYVSINQYKKTPDKNTNVQKTVLKQHL